MDGDDLVEYGGFGRHEGIGDFEATRKPMFGVKNIMRVAVLLFFDEPGLSGVAVEADGQVGYLFDNLVVADFWIQILEFTLLEWDQLNLVQNFILEHPQMLAPILSTVHHIQIHLRDYQAILPDTLNLLLQDSRPFFLQKGQFEVFSRCQQVIEHSYVVENGGCFPKKSLPLFLLLVTLGGHESVERRV